MTENNADESIDATPTTQSPPVQQPAYVAAPAAVPVAPKTSHTRTIIEVVGAVVAVGLIVAAGATGFVLGHVTARHHEGPGGGRMTLSMQRDAPDWGQGATPTRPGQGGTNGRQFGDDPQGGQGFQGGPGLPGGQDFQGGQSLPGFPGQDMMPPGLQPTIPQQSLPQS